MRLITTSGTFGTDGVIEPFQGSKNLEIRSPACYAGLSYSNAFGVGEIRNYLVAQYSRPILEINNHPFLLTALAANGNSR